MDTFGRRASAQPPFFQTNRKWTIDGSLNRPSYRNRRACDRLVCGKAMTIDCRGLRDKRMFFRRIVNDHSVSARLRYRAHQISVLMDDMLAAIGEQQLNPSKFLDPPTGVIVEFRRPN
jgi:hypothetical protein